MTKRNLIMKSLRYLSKNEIPGPMGSRHPSIAPFEAFKTKDSYIIIAAGNDKLFAKLLYVTSSYYSNSFHISWNLWIPI